MLIVHLATCAFMCGVIWIVQILHYPAFLEIDAANFQTFHRRHSRQISFIVAPVMITELATGLFILVRHRSDLVVIINFVLIIALWVCTFGLSVPLHNSIEKKRDVEKIKKLIQTNWPRTVLWSARTALLIFYAFSVGLT